MSVLLETSLGDLVVDLFTERCPLGSLNFIKLCKQKYYNNALFSRVDQNYIAEIMLDGVEKNSIYGLVDKSDRYFKDELTK
jgi:peptidyl-prolyl cis-trans isomerase-like 4